MVTLIGDPTLHATKFSLKTMSPTTNEFQKVQLGLSDHPFVSALPQHISVVITPILEAFYHIFAKPAGLPPFET